MHIWAAAQTCKSARISNEQAKRIRKLAEENSAALVNGNYGRVFGHRYFAAEVLASSALTRYNGLMNMRRLFGAFIAAFIFAFLFEWLLHGIVLRASEAALPQGLARAPADFQNHFLWVVLGQAIVVFMFTMIYARGFASGGVRAGVGLGIMFGIIYTCANLISYGVQPFPSDLVAWYSIAGFIEYAIIGIIVGTIYKTGPAMPV